MRKTLSMFLAFALTFAIAPLNVIAEGENVDLGIPEETVQPVESEVPVEENADVPSENATSEDVKPIETLNETDDRVLDEASTMACDAQAVACIGEVGFTSLNEAVASITDGTETTIKLNKNVDNATGITVASGRNITFDFNGHEYIVVGPGAGSAGTETNCFQLLKDSNLKFVNGTIKVSPNVKGIGRIFQSYANVTFKNFTVDATNLNYDYPLSFNCGNVIFSGNSNIYTKHEHAFDVYYWKTGGYLSGVSVTFDETFVGRVDNSIIYNSTDADKANLVIKGSGSFGKIVKSEGSTSTPKINVQAGTFDSVEVLDYLAEGANVNIVLTEDVNKSITVKANTNVTLDLNGHNITNTDKQHTIINNGNLTIKGNGNVDNTSHAKGALFNKGTATIQGGEFTRSNENGQSSSDNGGNSWYVISNEQGGTMVFDGGNVHSTGRHSSLVRNYGNMTVNDGNFNNGFIAIKSEEDTALTINGGVIQSSTQAIQTYGNTTINDGIISGQVTIVNWDKYKSTTTMNGGVVQGDVIVWDDANAIGKIDAVINGGEVNGKLVIWDDKKNPIEENSKLNIDVESGKFSNDVSKYVVPGKASIGVDNKFHVGTKDQVQAAANNAKDSVNVLVGVDSINVPEGVKVTNSSGKDIKVNDVTVKAGDVITVKAPVAQNDKPETKPVGGWDDGGPFTTNAEGDVFDRWGNLIYDAPSMGNTTNGYVFVNTSDK